MTIKEFKNNIGMYVNLVKTRQIETNPMKEIDSNKDVTKLEMRISSLSIIDLKLFDNKNRNKIVNINKLIMNYLYSIMEIIY